MRGRRAVAAAAAGAAGLLTLAGCSASRSDAAPTSPPASTASSITTQSATPTTPAPSSTPSSSPTRSPTRSATRSATGPTVSGACGNSQLAVSARALDGASQHGGYVVEFRNVSSRDCTLHGYPGVDAVRPGRPAVHATRALQGYLGGSQHGVPTVHLRAGGSGSAVLEYATTSDAAGDACPTAPRISVTAANTTRSVTLDVSVTICALEIHPTVSGTTGDDR